MFRFKIIASPLPDNSEHSYAAGAYVVAWIDAKNEANAEVVAHDRIAEANWTPGDTIEASEVSRESYSDDHEDLKYFLEAVEHGDSLVFHTWPVDAKDANVDYESS